MLRHRQSIKFLEGVSFKVDPEVLNLIYSSLDMSATINSIYIRIQVMTKMYLADILNFMNSFSTIIQAFNTFSIKSFNTIKTLEGPSTFTLNPI